MSLKTLEVTAYGSGVAIPSGLYSLANFGATVNRLRPRNKVRVIGTIQVKPDGTKDYTTVLAANDAALTMQNAKMTAEGISFRTPNFTVEVIIHPGTYVQTSVLDLNPYVSFISATGVAGDVVIRSTDLISTSLGTLTSSGDFYLEGLDIVRAGTTPANSGKYCHHIALQDFETGVAVNCRFYTETSHTTGGWTCAGMDGSPGIGLIYHNCEFWQKSTGTYAAGGTNLHGLIGGATSGAVSDIIFSNCKAGSVGYDALNNVIADKIWVDSGMYTAVTGVGSLVTVNWSGATGTMSAPGGALNSISGMPVISGGMTPREYLHFWGTPA